MALTFHCPRCLMHLQVPPGMMGQQVVCPGCQANFMLSPMHLQPSQESTAPPAATSAPATAATSKPVAQKAGPPAAPMAPPSAPPATSTATLAAPPVLAEPPRPMTPPAQTTEPPASKRVPASGKTSVLPPGSTLKPASDGKLPTLALEAEATADDANQERQGPSTLVVFATLAVSVALSLAMLLVDFDTMESTGSSAFDTRRQLQQFFGEEGRPLQKYQVLLRESQLAHSQRDYARERECYRKVLKLLRAEGRGPTQALTGSAYDDAELERLVTTLLRQVPQSSSLLP